MRDYLLVLEEHKGSFYELRRVGKGSEGLRLNVLLLGGGGEGISVLAVLE